MRRIPEDVMSPATFLVALEKLSEECVPHPCGGFTTDDVEWRLGTAFTPQAQLDAAIEELTRQGRIRFAGHDENDAVGACYELAPPQAVTNSHGTR